MKSRNLFLAAAGLGLALSGVLPAVATAETSGDVSVQDVHRKSAKCRTPEGQKINISWGDGSVTTTVYYNNHCNQARAIELEFVKESGERFNKCFVAPARTQGSKKIDNGNPNKVSILGASRCP
ncbi:hypothetical protein C8D88_11741 [Lentzea atacamensis]|uniref:Uncharacterized protein n=2 Tax=Lentzea TaxID=165301 RepID=A0A316HLN3_9PSEU|nr:hypothetical protein [Lentzea atacamensis]PWK81419.1 hypothetical protein C8D88_11741 [Lentzea atacamensis]